MKRISKILFTGTVPMNNKHTGTEKKIHLTDTGTVPVYNHFLYYNRNKICA